MPLAFVPLNIIEKVEFCHGTGSVVNPYKEWIQRLLKINLFELYHQPFEVTCNIEFSNSSSSYFIGMCAYSSLLYSKSSQIQTKLLYS